MESWRTMTAADLGRGIAAGDIDAVALTETFLDAISGSKDIYARTTTERARAEAAAAAERAKTGNRLGPLDGVPISWKDLYDTAGVATESGSKLLEGRVPDADARVLALATRAGLVCLGKTHQTELAFSGLGYNPVTATPPNVHDADVVPGGSSSGAAASVAFGLAAIGIGSDTGGSVRIPSVWNDLVGLKTRSGRLSLRGVVPLCARFDTVGPLCRSVEDAALMLAVMDGGAPASLDGATLDGTRFAVLKTIAFDNIEDAPRAAFQSAVDRLSAAGAKIEYIEIPQVAEAAKLGPTLFPAEAYATWRHLIEAKPDMMFAPVRERFLQGDKISAADFIGGWQRLDVLRDEYLAATAAFDAVLVPTAPILPPKVSDLEADHDYFTARNLLALQNTRIGNLLGLAAVTLPTGVPACGISLQGPSEERLLRLAAAAEQALS